MGLTPGADGWVAAPRIGVFGGSFDPPHLAHLALARLAVRSLGLDELRWIPAGQPWQKAGRTLADAEHRLAMIRLLTEGEPRCLVDRREVDRQGPSYTVDTLRELAAERPGAELVLVIGQDQYGRLDTWRAWPDLLRLATVAVAARAGVAPAPPLALAAVAHRLLPLTLPEMPISSTAVREAARQGANLVPMVGEAVAGYISRHHLYGDPLPH